MTHGKPHPLPSPVLQEVDVVVAEIRARRPLRLDVDRLAGALGVRLAYRDLGQRLLGLTMGEDAVLLHRDLRGARLQFVFAHELAHVLRRRGRFPTVAPKQEEWFADWFARELVLPRRWLSTPWPHAKLASLHVDLETVALQMATLDLCPSLMRNGRRVLCRACGTGAHSWNCACRPWRRGDLCLHDLPDVRGLQLLRAPTGRYDAPLPLDASLALASST